MRVIRRHKRPSLRSSTGFSLIEVLVAIAILGLIALIAASQVSRTMKLARLSGAQRDLQAMAQRASSEMKMRGVVTFLELSRLTVGRDAPCWQARLFSDGDATGAGADGSLQTASDTLLQTLHLPQDISFSTASTTAMATANWSGTNPADDTARYLICDTLTRTEVPGPSAGQLVQITRPATLDITQNDMVPATGTPRIAPPVRFQLRVAAVWNPSISRGVWNSDTSKWSDE